MTVSSSESDTTARPAANGGVAAPPGDAQLEVTGVDKIYQARRGEVHALSNVNLSIARGEFISLVGRSGCGKTTLLRILAGLLPPSSGTVTADGESIWRGGKRNDEAFEHFGLVFQDANLFPWYTVADNISLPLKLRGVGRKARRARAADRFVLLTPRPGRIRSVTPVPLARPRSLETETSAEFQEIVRVLRHELDEE
jgi:NitT/TauT family transport system ATP-binding protein